MLSLHLESFQGVDRVTGSVTKTSHEERHIKMNLAKEGVRKRRNRQMQVEFRSLNSYLYTRKRLVVLRTTKSRNFKIVCARWNLDLLVVLV